MMVGYKIAYSTKRFSNLFVLTILISLLSTTTAAAVYTIQEFGTDSSRYAVGSNITVSGKILNGTTWEPGANVTIELFNSGGTLINSNTTTTDSTGYFSEIIQTTALSSGTYTIIPSAPAIGAAASGVNVR